MKGERLTDCSSDCIRCMIVCVIVGVAEGCGLLSSVECGQSLEIAKFTP